MLDFSDILNRISRKHGGKPTAPKPLSAEAFRRPDLGLEIDPEGASRGIPGFTQEPTQEIQKGIMERLFKNALHVPGEGAGAPPPRPAVAPALRPAAAPRTVPSRPAEIRGFRNHAELLKFSSLLINDIEDTIRAR